MTNLRASIPKPRTPFALVLALLVSGCAVPGSQRAPAPVEDRGSAAAPAQGRPEAIPESESRPSEFQPLPPAEAGAEAPPQTAEPAVVALLDDSDRKLRSGQPEAAAAALERALRISPGNALLWHRLAAIRLEQGRWSQAEALAQKSLALGGNEPRLQADNWTLIARARRELGDAAGARAAENAAARTGSVGD